MKQKTINVYEYDELSEKAKEKVIEMFRDRNDFPFLDDELQSWLIEFLEKENIIFNENPKIYYSLSCRQGDGFCFTGTFKWKNYNVYIIHRNSYYHERSTDISLEPEYEIADEDDIKNVFLEEDEKAFREIYYSICERCEKLGYEIMEHQNSEEAIKDMIKANEYTFRENGDLEII